MRAHFLGLGGADLTVTEWKILEALVTLEAQSRFGRRCPTVPEMTSAARDVRSRFASEEDLKRHLHALRTEWWRTRREDARRRQRDAPADTEKRKG
jgi:hypothetical protein